MAGFEAFSREDGIGILIQLLIAALIIVGAILESALRKRAARRQEEREEEEEEAAPDLGSEYDTAQQEFLDQLPHDRQEEPRPDPIPPVPAPVAPPHPSAGPPMPAFRLAEEPEAVPIPSRAKVTPVPAPTPVLSIEARLARLSRRPLTANQQAFVLTQVFGSPRHTRLLREGVRGLVHRV